jgi:alpha-methylacyl-CoA racemase
MGWWHAERGSNLLDSGAHFYDVYETSDGRYMAVGAIEPQFYALLLEGLELDASQLPAQLDRASWPAMKRRFTEVFGTRTRDEWTRIFADSDACVSPVLTPEEASTHPHATERQSFRRAFDVLHPSPVPRFSRSPRARSTRHPGRDSTPTNCCTRSLSTRPR